MSIMTNEEIAAEFEELFGGNTEESDETEPDTNEDVDEQQTDESEEDTAEEETTEEEKEEEEKKDEEEKPDEGESESKPAPKADKKAKQNHAFAEQRLQIKQNEQFIRGIGKLIGFDDKAPLSDIQDKIKEVLIEKEAKDNNISVELAKKLDWAEQMAQENDRIKLEKKVQEDFSDLIDKHNLDEEAVNEFTTHLLDIGKNPLEDPSVDIEAEYLKLHFQDMIDAAVSEALSKEESRQKKVEEKAASGVTKGAKDKEETKINSVKELDDLFDSMDL